MLRSVAALLARSGDYCIADVIDAHGKVRRLEIAHADPSRRERLRVAADDTTHGPNGRVARLLQTGRPESLAHVSRAARARDLADIVLVHGETFCSYMAAAVWVSGAPMAVLTMVATKPARSFGTDELAELAVVSEWTGLGLENALRRELQPRASVAPPSGVERVKHDLDGHAPSMEELRRASRIPRG
ncbi:MAG: hypothetical protein JWP87_794 [Labilithrix sp.]|nr:hypothetical protein [Labilithrix sp.]